MFIFWGTRSQERKLGFVADFCPVCRKIAPFRVTAVSRVSHLYGVSMGSGDLLGHTGTCQVCTNRIGLDVADYYDFAMEPGSDLEALIRQTFPGIRALRGPRLELEDRLRAGTLYPNEREELVMEAFLIFADLTEANFSGSTEIRGRGGWGCLGTILLCLAAVVVGITLEKEEHVASAVMAIAVVGGLASLVLLVLEPGRIFARKILPDFAATLRPLNPSPEQLARLLSRFKMGGYKLGKKLKPERLSKALEALPAPETAEPASRQNPRPASDEPPAAALDDATFAAAERREQILGTFHAFARLTQATYGGGIHVRGRGGWGCLGTLLTCIAVGWAGSQLASERAQEDHVVQIVAIIAVAGGVWSFVQLLLEPGRIFTRKIYPELVAELRPLEPTCEEINDILTRLKAAGFKLGSKVRPEWLCAALEAQPAPVGPPPLPVIPEKPTPPSSDDMLF